MGWQRIGVASGDQRQWVTTNSQNGLSHNQLANPEASSPAVKQVWRLTRIGAEVSSEADDPEDPEARIKTHRGDPFSDSCNERSSSTATRLVAFPVAFDQPRDEIELPHKNRHRQADDQFGHVSSHPKGCPHVSAMAAEAP